MPTVSITEVKQAAGSEQTPAVQLYIEWLAYVRAAQELEGRRECLEKAGYVDWRCCPEHRQLQTRNEEFRSRASEILPADDQLDTGAVFSQRWWSKLSINHAYDAVVVE